MRHGAVLSLMAVPVLYAGCKDSTAPVAGPLTGSLLVTTVTVGDTLDWDGYTVTLNDTTTAVVPINGGILLSGLEAGDHSVELTDVQVNCQVSGANRQSVSITAGDTAQLSFGLNCVVALFNHIAFHSNRDGNFDIYVMLADGSGHTNLTNHLAQDAEPAFSPSGSHIAFTSNRDGNREIYVMDVDGSKLKNLTNNPAEDRYPAWSPDGSQIAFVSNRDGNDEIYVMGADGSNLWNLTNNSALDIEPAWSPDGMQILFISNRDAGYPRAVFVMDDDGENPRRLVENLMWNGGPDWSPDGTMLAYHTGEHTYEIYVKEFESGKVLTRTSFEGEAVHPAWSPDGSRIAFALGWEPEVPDVYVMRADGSDLRNLTNAAGWDGMPTWSPTR